MPFDDLDLEFEDEEEIKRKKKGDAVQVDVDLEFQAPESVKPRPSQPARPAASAGTSPNITGAGPARPAEVRNIQEARAAQAPVKKPVAPQAAAPKTVGSSALQEDTFEIGAQEVVGLREELRTIQFEADVKVAVAEFKSEFLAEMLSDMKLAQHQVEQLLVRINAKHPDMKNEVLMIKKILADFVTKKRK